MNKRNIAIILFVLMIPICVSAILQVDLKKQAFNDFNSFFNRVDHIGDEINSVYVNITAIENMKTDILDDPARKAALKKLVDLHPDYDLADLATKINKLSTLKAWLEDNGFVQ